MTECRQCSAEVALDLKRVVHASANVMENIERGGGLLHEVIYNPQLAKSGAALLGEVQQSAQHLNQALVRVDGLLAAVQNGNGTLHGLVYRDDGGKLLAEAQHAVVDLTSILTEVRRGRGTLHGLVYDDGKTNLVADRGAAAHILRGLAEQVQQGKGTVGAAARPHSVSRPQAHPGQRPAEHPAQSADSLRNLQRWAQAGKHGAPLSELARGWAADSDLLQPSLTESREKDSPSRASRVSE